MIKVIIDYFNRTLICYQKNVLKDQITFIVVFHSVFHKHQTITFKLMLINIAKMLKWRNE